MLLAAILVFWMVDHATGWSRMARWARGVVASRGSSRRLAFRTAASLLSVSTLFLFAECALRWKNAGTLGGGGTWLTWVPDPDLAYKLNPGNPSFPGSFVGRAPGLPKPSGQIRVLCLGGSTTFGHGVTASEAWPALLETELRGRGLPTAVYNAGCPGYGSRHQITRYERRLRRFDSDLVVIYSGWNGTGILTDPDGFLPDGIPREGDGLLRRLCLSFARHSILCHRVFDRFLHMQRGGQRDAPVRSRWYVERGMDAFVEDLTRLVGEIREDGATPILVKYPSLLHMDMTEAEFRQYTPRIAYAPEHREEMVASYLRRVGQVASIAERTGTLLADVQGALSEVRGPQRVALFLDEMHMTVEGNRHVASILADALGPVVQERVQDPP